MDTQPTIDTNWFEALHKKRPEFLRRLIGVFMQEEPGRLTALHEALILRNLAQAATLAHALKGATATMGATEASRLCLQVEQAVKLGDCSTATAALNSLDLEMDRVYAFMADYLKAKPDCP